jgi:hypothetical protein
LLDDPGMTAHPTTDQINTALTRAAWVARERTRYPDRLAELSLLSESSEFKGDGWWLIGWIGVVGEPEERNVLHDPETDQGRLRAALKPR